MIFTIQLCEIALCKVNIKKNIPEKSVKIDNFLEIMLDILFLNQDWGYSNFVS